MGPFMLMFPTENRFFLFRKMKNFLYKSRMTSSDKNEGSTAKDEDYIIEMLQQIYISALKIAISCAGVGVCIFLRD